MIDVEKAFAYVTQDRHLLVFTHPDAPDAGIQVPAGTIRPGEVPADAALRETREETGLSHLRLAGFLGYTRYDMSGFGIAEVHHRHFFHIFCDEATPDRWQHCESDPSGTPEGDAAIRLDFAWVELPDNVPTLIAGQGDFIPTLAARLGLP